MVFTSVVAFLVVSMTISGMNYNPEMEGTLVIQILRNSGHEMPGTSLSIERVSERRGVWEQRKE